MGKITGKYHFKHYTIDRYTFEREAGKEPFIETNVMLEEREGILTGKICSQFGEGKIEVTDRWDDTVCCFGGDMGGERRVWWSLKLENGKLMGTVMPWEKYSSVKWPLHIIGEKVEGNDSEAEGIYLLNYYNSDLNTEKKTEEKTSCAYLFLEQEEGEIRGRLDYPVGTGKVSEVEKKDGWLFCRVDYAAGDNTWYRIKIEDEKLCGDVTPYPFHFAWPFLVEGERA